MGSVSHFEGWAQRQKLVLETASNVFLNKRSKVSTLQYMVFLFWHLVLSVLVFRRKKMIGNNLLFVKLILTCIESMSYIHYLETPFIYS